MSMQSLAVSLLPARFALLRRFQRFYLLLALPTTLKSSYNPKR